MNFAPWPYSDEREIELLREALAPGGRWGGFHEMVERFEKQFAAFQHARHGISAMNGTITLEMALEAAGIGAGDEVIVPAISFVSTATAVSRVGATPVFVDIEPLTFHIDPNCAARAVSARTKAIMPVHFGGPMADMDRIVKLGVTVIEDAAHAHGSEWRGRRAGSIGLAGSFSFQNSKVMTAGEGGLLTTDDDAFASRLRAIANQGRREGRGWFEHYTPGSNYRMTALQAAVLLAQLERLPEQNCRRRRNAAILRHELRDVPGLSLQEIRPEADVHTNYLFLGRIDAAKFGMSRDEFHRALADRGIPCTPYYPHTLYQNPLYREAPCRVEPCPVAEATIQDAFWLQHRVLLGSEDDAREIARAIQDLR